jgi:regulator of sigma E protease
MIDFLYKFAIFVIALTPLVAIHEFGHFWVARRCGVHVIKFSIGFGKALYTWRDKAGTEYSLSAIPFGGYVKMLGEQAGDVPEDKLHLAFNRKPVLSRIAIVSAGPLANLGLAVVVYWFLFMSGETGSVPIIEEVRADSIAEQAGLQAGQEIIAVDGKETPTWQALSFRLLDRIGDTGTVTLSVKSPGSDLALERTAQIDRWLYDQETPDLYGGLGITLFTPEILPIVGEVVAESPAFRAGLHPGDLVLSADGVQMALWNDWVDYVRARPEQLIQLEILRDGSSLQIGITPERLQDSDGNDFGRVGVAVVPPEMPPHLVREFERGPIDSLGAAFGRTWEISLFTLTSIKKMITGLISPKNLSGPITIAKVATASAEYGPASFFSFLALLSVSLGVLNLLPIPVLDGGHLLFYTLELLAGRPVPEKIQILGYQAGLFLVLGIMMLALYNDFARL